MDPYYNTTFFEWVAVLWKRVVSFHGGALYSDEIQLSVLVLFGITSSLLGVFLVLSKNILLANSISHTMLFGLVIAFIAMQYVRPDTYLLPSTVIYGAAAIVGLGTCSIVERLSKLQYLSVDSSNAMVFSFFFALGIAIISVYSKNAHIGPELLMGDPDALFESDIPAVFVTALLTMVAIPLMLRRTTIAIFDPSFATVSGFKPDLCMRIVLLLTSVASIVAFRAVGFVMTMAFFVFPALIAKTRATSVVQMLTFAAIVSMSVAFLSVGLSRHLYTVYGIPIATGAFAAVLLALVYGIVSVSLVVKKVLLRA